MLQALSHTLFKRMCEFVFKQVQSNANPFRDGLVAHKEKERNWEKFKLQRKYIESIRAVCICVWEEYVLVNGCMRYEIISPAFIHMSVLENDSQQIVSGIVVFVSLQWMEESSILKTFNFHNLKLGAYHSIELTVNDRIHLIRVSTKWHGLYFICTGFLCAITQLVAQSIA